MTSAPAHAVAPTGHRAAHDLAAVREQWGDLLAAIGSPPAAEWPPRDSRAYIDGRLADDAYGEEEHESPSLGRMPLTLREHPAPIDLTALDAALEVERDLFDLADRVAAAVQRPISPALDADGRHLAEQPDATDPARWHFQAPGSPGSRAYGLHWAALWIAGRALGEIEGDLFTPLPVRLLDEVTGAAHRARRTVERALGRDARTTAIDDPCPWCGGQLTGHARPGGECAVTCSAGPQCTAAAPLDDRRRRVWQGADLVLLWTALDRARGERG
ncbi:hypothetical protein ACFCV9_32545 [Streptomyces sp. NPDC056367]|uniref:hypothetical protein n=1 Tax=Streptomyces sp. NPDC056367 TaxID=3345797 RepID=UPI0035D54892